ncbi:MAG: hypothetical protein WCO13_06850 [Bacteroidota bacterium]
METQNLKFYLPDSKKFEHSHVPSMDAYHKLYSDCSSLPTVFMTIKPFLAEADFILIENDLSKKKYAR